MQQPETKAEHEIFEDFKRQLPDVDPEETGEWIDSLDALVKDGGPQRARFVMYKLLKRARQLHIGLPPLTQTRYINTISPEQEPYFPGDEDMERRIRRMIRWNAVAMVMRANHDYPGIGGHLATYASAATLYEVGFNWFFRGKDDGRIGDRVYYQGHASPGMYARAFLEGRIDQDRLDHFRREALTNGLPSYPHPRTMPDFWEYPTVSMGLGPISAIHQARFDKYLHARGIADTSGSKVWGFLGDGEMDEPEAQASLRLAGREGLDNLIFVVNCNLQRLDGPVRGNGKIVQELEGLFRGAGWNVIKVLWGREWDDLLARDVDGVLVNRMNQWLDGDSQRMAISDGATIRREFFGTDQRLLKLVEHLSDDDLAKLRRGGHDYRKVYSAYWMATQHTGDPTVILAQTVKGWALGPSVQARNVTHQAKKMSVDELKIFRDRLELPIPDDQLEDPPYYHPGMDAPEIRYMLDRRRQLGGSVPKRVVLPTAKLPMPDAAAFAEFPQGSGKAAVSTTMAFTRLLRNLTRDKTIGRRVVPIIPDEARTFGMDPLFKEIGIYSPLGQRYRPVDAETLMPYRESEDGQLIEEGITEAGSVATFTAAGTSYATTGAATIPFYVFYSMFGFQRTMDQIWAFGDARGRGFMMAGTAGRTTLMGEGLQHTDGHSQLLATAMPNVRAYDPAYAYETAVIVQDGLRRMFERGEDVFYYVTLYNENYVMPAMPEGVEEGILRGLYLFRKGVDGRRRVQLLGSGPILNEALRAQEMLQDKYDVAADVWSVTSYQLLRNEALEVERWNRLHPAEHPRRPFVVEKLGALAPIVAATDYVKAIPDQIGRWTGQPFLPLGTDGFGRSDTREALRRHFEVDAENIAVAALHALAQCEQLAAADVAKAIADLGIDPQRVDPRYA
ncbi:MAG: pyruvate dehydrogenase (acetyl-transferring), homodimeric type [Chloroflexota bacterium]|nr:pyruvate dehydrogenase (acetyl-transferring), homodimeric type [Chloroflexota bacterium]